VLHWITHPDIDDSYINGAYGLLYVGAVLPYLPAAQWEEVQLMKHVRSDLMRIANLSDREALAELELLDRRIDTGRRHVHQEIDRQTTTASVGLQQIAEWIAHRLRDQRSIYYQCYR